MPTYTNASAQHLSFDIGDEHYEVPPGAACEIPKLMTYVIASRGLPLTRGAAADAEVVESTEAHAPPMRLPAGVETGPARDAEDDEPGDAEGAEGAAAVDAAVAGLERQGVAVPGRKARR